MLFVFFNDTATTEIYTLSLHDALPISSRFSDALWATDGLLPGRRRSATRLGGLGMIVPHDRLGRRPGCPRSGEDRKSTRLNSSHANISYAVFCLKKKTTIIISHTGVLV